ncbi:MAG: hypothetical protein ACYTFG_18430 [Planctomycetota bacterium]|jgi:hypothetical protein
MMFPARIFALLLVAAGMFWGAAPASAQFSGDEIHDRTWNYSSRYFFKVLSFRMPWRWEDTWRSAESGYLIELGSVLTDEFFIRQEAKITQRPADWLRVRFHYKQAEDFDSRFRKHRVDLEYPVWDRLFPAVFTEVDPFKEWIDLGLKLHGSLPGLYRGSVGLTLVDAVYNRKAKEGKYGILPLALEHESHFVVVPNRFVVSLSTSNDFPLLLDLPSESMEVRFCRNRLAMFAGVQLDQGWEFRIEVSAEWMRRFRNFDKYTPLDPRTQRFRRDAGHGRVEVVRIWTRSDRFSETITAGFQWLQILETWMYANDHVEDRRLWKRDFVFYGSWKHRLWSPVYGRVKVLFGTLEHDDHYTNQAVRNHEKNHPFAAKIGYFVGFQFAPGVDIAMFAHFEADVVEFGGGGVTAIIVF